MTDKQKIEMLRYAMARILHKSPTLAHAEEIAGDALALTAPGHKADPIPSGQIDCIYCDGKGLCASRVNDKLFWVQCNQCEGTGKVGCKAETAPVMNPSHAAMVHAEELATHPPSTEPKPSEAVKRCSTKNHITGIRCYLDEGHAGIHSLWGTDDNKLEDMLRLILPMAKGYAYCHQVGNNQLFIAQAEALLDGLLELKRRATPPTEGATTKEKI